MSYETSTMEANLVARIFTHGKKVKGDIKRLNTLFVMLNSIPRPMTAIRRLIKPALSQEAYKCFCRISDNVDTWRGHTYHGSQRLSNIVLSALALESQEPKPRNDIIVLASALLYYEYNTMVSEEENRSFVGVRVPSDLLDGIDEEKKMDIFRIIGSSGQWNRRDLMEDTCDPLLSTMRNLSDAEFLTTFGISFEMFLRDHRALVNENGLMVNEDEALKFVKNSLFPFIGSGRNTEFGEFSRRLCNEQDVKSVPVIKKKAIA